MFLLRWLGRRIKNSDSTCILYSKRGEWHVDIEPWLIVMN